MELQHTYDVPGSGVVLLTHDSLLLAYHPSSGRTGVIDVKLPQGQLLGGFLHVQAPANEELPPGTERRTWRHALPNTLFDPASGVSFAVSCWAALNILDRPALQCCFISGAATRVRGFLRVYNDYLLLNPPAS